MEILLILLNKIQQIYDGILNLIKDNANNMILQGYLQKKLKTPKFALTVEKQVAKFIYDEMPQIWYNALELKTKSSDSWDFKIIGLTFGGDNLLPLAHYQTIELSLNQYTQFPKGIFNYFMKKYDKLFTVFGKIAFLQNCKNCDCLDQYNFPEIKIYTEKVMIKLTAKQYFNVNKANSTKCCIEQSLDKFYLSQSFYQHYSSRINQYYGDTILSVLYHYKLNDYDSFNIYCNKI
ncbi:transmembrane protein, putative (macronuclear) [Tetrahymena thermophila SB210]|uniref:Transmembrane protein, putative n=1 Tax=Tetrahymena thermophila (strain SB210) TaxID=312017 RepID=Q23FK4_TETTS|nr:transmembrane protein, putative [Tetrahymena thermophila SB210]EAR95606.2 transmembrane protein, putative [Tetrahymena thermophila SB210]|eukprot:XP_001015851.2 transmembrane protein, putative [Tetrahymena thermophila SB210]